MNYAVGGREGRGIGDRNGRGSREGGWGDGEMG